MTGMEAAWALAAIGAIIAAIGIPIAALMEQYRILRILIAVTTIFALPLVLRLYTTAILG